MPLPDLLQIYECLCDPTRLRILNLLQQVPLCVCHLQELLDEPQVKISKHLSYLRSRGLVEVTRHQNWMVYALPSRKSHELDANLRCLQDCGQTDPVLKQDLKRLAKLQPSLCIPERAPCCSSKTRGAYRHAATRTAPVPRKNRNRGER